MMILACCSGEWIGLYDYSWKRQIRSTVPAPISANWPALRFGMTEPPDWGQAPLFMSLRLANCEHRLKKWRRVSLTRIRPPRLDRATPRPQGLWAVSVHHGSVASTCPVPASARSAQLAAVLPAETFPECAGTSHRAAEWQISR